MRTPILEAFSAHYLTALPLRRSTRKLSGKALFVRCEPDPEPPATLYRKVLELEVSLFYAPPTSTPTLLYSPRKGEEEQPFLRQRRAAPTGSIPYLLQG